jgi:hypothetical protein
MPYSALPKSGTVFLQSLLVPAILTGLWLLFLRNALDGSTSFALFIDNEFFLGPVLSSMSESLRAGEWPLRMDTVLGGLPIYNFTQLTPFYPLYLLPLHLYDTPQAAIHGMHMVVLLHLLVMEINLYVFLRVVGASRLAAVTGAALIAFSANSFSYVVWLNIVAPYAWFPLFLAGMVGLAQGRARRPYAMMTCIGIVMLTFASPAQPLIHALFMAGVLAAFFLWQSGVKRNYGVIPGFVVPLAALGLLSLLIVAPALVPQFVEFGNMIRWIGAFPPVYGNEPIPFAAFEAEQLARADLGGVLFKFRGVAVGQQFIGLVVAALALLKALSPQRTWIVNALVFVAVYALLSSFGSDLGLGYLNYRIPLLNKIREPSRFLFLFQFAAAALAALALDDLRQLAASQSRFLKRQVLALAALVGAALLIRLLLPERIVAALPPFVSMLILVLLLAFTWLAARLPFAQRGLLLASAWSVAALGMLMQEVSWQPPPVSYSQYETGDLAPLDGALQRIVELDPAHDYRVIFDGSIDKQVAAMLASYRGIRTLNSYFNPAPRRQFEELYYHGVRADNYARVLGAKYLLCKDCPAAAVQGYSLAERIGAYDLYSTTDVLPHSYLATDISGDFANLGEFTVKAAALPLDAKFLFVETAQRPLLQEAAMAASAVCGSKEEARSANRVSISVECDGPGVLVLNKFHERHWRARIDGGKVDLLKVNGNQMGVQVPAGTHQVEFSYRPAVVVFTLVLSALALLFALYLASRRTVAGIRRGQAQS